MRENEDQDDRESRPALPTVCDWSRDSSLAPEGKELLVWVAADDQEEDEGTWTALLRDGGKWTLLQAHLRVVAWAPVPKLTPPSQRLTVSGAALEVWRQEAEREGAAKAYRNAAELGRSRIRAALVHVEHDLAQLSVTAGQLRATIDEREADLVALADEEDLEKSAAAGCEQTLTTETVG